VIVGCRVTTGSEWRSIERRSFYYVNIVRLKLYQKNDTKNPTPKQSTSGTGGVVITKKRFFKRVYGN